MKGNKEVTKNKCTQILARKGWSRFLEMIHKNKHRGWIKFVRRSILQIGLRRIRIWFSQSAVR